MIMMSAVMSTSFSRPSPFNDDGEKLKIITLIMVIRVILMPLVLIMMSAMKSCWYNIDNWDKYERFFFGLNWQLCLIAWAWQFVTLCRTCLSRFVVHTCHILLYLIVVLGCHVLLYTLVTYCCTWLLYLVVTLVCHVLLCWFVTLALDFFIWNREEADILEPLQLWQLGNSGLLQRVRGFLLIYRVTKKSWNSPLTFAQTIMCV